MTLASRSARIMVKLMDRHRMPSNSHDQRVVLHETNKKDKQAKLLYNAKANTIGS
jgi:hypothetical protein